MNTITVFTPTYNREKTLPRLYQSLLKQSYKNFEWLIIDDGSVDNTESLINKWIAEEKLAISYYKQKNGGKHRAINKGLDHAKGELFFIVDSDDYLPANSLEIVCKRYLTIKEDNSIIGIVGLYATPNGTILKNQQFPLDVVDTNLIERRERYGITVDMAKVIKTNKFKEFRFPDIVGENFVAESIVWNRMALEYKFRYFNEVIYIAEYFEDGLSSNSIRNRRKNPKYATLLYKELAHNPKAPIKLKFKSIINFWRFGFCDTKNIFALLKKINNFPLALIALPLGFGLYIKDSYSDDINIKKMNNDG
ncbi:glycosyltransferase family 2 protein [Chryseobacterium proteolyticum]|uniref:glycosyltransferase family 2 protein n=1 Tax=Chryseobacterium proteolyticum TaxID=118127 RepID=UPI0039837CC8